MLLQCKLETLACIGEVEILAMFLMWHALLIYYTAWKATIQIMWPVS